MPELGIDGTLFHYEEAGSGAPLVLLHGGLGTAALHLWREIEFFGRGFRVVAPDLRGYGRSTPPRSFPADFYDRDAEDVAALLAALFDHPVHLAGWSDGGIVALIVAARRPELVRSLAVWGAQARLTAAERAGWPALADASSWPEGARRRFIEAQGPQNWPEILQRMVDGYHAYYNARDGDIITTELHAIRAPVLILHGEDDAVVPVLHAHDMAAALPHVRLRIFPGAGHAVHREREADLREELLRLFASFQG